MIIKDSKHSFEVVEKIPQGYEIWNIGDNMIDGYIPLAEEVEKYKINPNTLKAIKLDPNELTLLRKSANYGVVDLKSAKRAINRKAPKTYIAIRKKELAEKTITIFERLS